MDPPPPSATTAIDNSMNGGGKGDRISGQYYENLSEDHEGGSEADDSNNFYERKVLPPEHSRSTVKLTCDSTAEGGGVCDVYLVGTAHVSTESCEEVQAVIDFLKPQVKQLLAIPSEKKSIPVGKILSTIGVTVAGVAIISGIYLSIKK